VNGNGSSNGNGNNGNKPNVIPGTTERAPELGRYKSAASRDRALRNLRPLTPERALVMGQHSGNVRRLQAQFSDEIDRELRKRPANDPEHRTWRELLITGLVKSAVIHRDVQAAKLLMDRWLGPLPFDAADLAPPERIHIVVFRNQPRQFPVALPKPEENS